MYRHIVVPLDGSVFAERAIPAALAIARLAGATVELVHVHEAPTSLVDLQTDAVCAGLDHLVDRLARTNGPSVRLTCLKGDVSESLGRQIAASRADLIVLATHGEGGLTRVLLGSIGDHLVRHSGVPVLLVRAGGLGPLTAEEPLFEHVLVPLDGSELATHVIEPALAVASPGRTRVTLLRVLDVVSSGSETQRLTRQAALPLEASATELRASGYHTTVAVRQNEDVARGILYFARQQRVDLIAISTHGRGRIRRSLFGSVADVVIRQAQVPVLALHSSNVMA